MRPPGRSSWRRRALAVLLGLVLAPVLVEVALQVASLLPERTRDIGAGECLVLCQGDSNTYGFNLDANLSYPAQLEALLRAREPGARVVNRGVPGKPTWIVRDELDADLARHRPRALAVLCGLNDRDMLRPEDRASRIFGRIRIVALVRRLISAGRSSAEWIPEEEEEPNILTHRSMEKLDRETSRVHFKDREAGVRSFLVRFGSTEPEVYREWIAEDLAEVAERSRAAGVVPLLVAYPLDSGPFTAVNEGICEAARRSGARLVDPRPWFEQAMASVPKDELVFPDGHPTELGYSILARLVLAALVEEGAVSLEATDPLERLATWTPPVLAVELLREQVRAVGVRVRYGPGYRAQLMLSGSPGETPVRWRGVAYPVDEGPHHRIVPLARDEVFEAAWRSAEGYLVPLGADGTAEIRLADALLGPEAEARDLWAAVVVVAPGSRVVAVSEAVRLR